jgi:lipopolysaccharide export system protein LptA
VLSVEVSGHVLFEIGRLRVQTENLTYDRATSHIHAPGEAHVEAAELSLSGTDMTVNMLERSVVIGSGVKMTLHPKDGAAPAADATGSPQPAPQVARP